MGAVQQRFADLPQLAAVLSLDLYRDNPFRILDVPVTASMREIRQQQRRLETQQRLLGCGEPAPAERLLCSGRADAQTARLAMERLADPKARFVAELFWFWPLGADPDADPALNAVRAGDYAAALRLWKAATDVVERSIARRNRTVLRHFLALECERPGMGLGSGLARVPLTQEGLAQLDDLWDAAMAGWQRVLLDVRLWTLFKQRFAVLDPGQRTDDYLLVLRGALMPAMFEIGALAAYALAQQGDPERAASHAARLRRLDEQRGQLRDKLQSAPLSEPLSEILSELQSELQCDIQSGSQVNPKDAHRSDASTDALRGVLQPVREKLEVAAREAAERVQENPSASRETCAALFDAAEPPLRTVRALLVADDPLNALLHDSVADAACQCALTYADATADWSGALSLLEHAQQISQGQAVKERLREERERLDGAHRRGLCFFCAERPGSEADALLVHLHGEVIETPVYNAALGQPSTRLQWKSAKARVPRCPRCRRVHDCRLAEEHRAEPPKRPEPLPPRFSIPNSGMLLTVALLFGTVSGLTIALTVEFGLRVPVQAIVICALSIVVGVLLVIAGRLRGGDRRELAAYRLRLATYRRDLAAFRQQRADNASRLRECEKQRKASPDDWLPVQPIDAYCDYPPIRELHREGWQFGKKPPAARKGSEDAGVFDL